MQSKRLWLLILLFLFTHLHANHAEDQTRCERANGIYVLDKKTLSWGCYTLAYSIGDRSETSENRKKCEYSDKLYGWNGSQYDCFFPKHFISQPIASAIPPQAYTNATLERRALCEQNGNAFIWNGEENTWACRPMAYRINDKRINPTNQSSCESYGNQYLWDGKYYHCIGTKPIIPPTIEIKPNETLVRREQCEKNGDLFRWSDSSNTWECVSIHEPKTPNETLIRRETCEQKGDIFEWNGTKNQWECIAKQTAQERKFLEQRKQACENLKKALIWNKNANDWECLPTSTSVSAIPYNEAQEKRAICEQRGFLYLWNGVNNEWQCFKHTDTLIDTDINPSRKTQCDTLGFYYLELENKKWSCVDDVPKPEKQNLELTTIKSKCDKYNGTLTWQEHRWVCSTKSTKEEIEKAQTPSFKSPTPITQEKSRFKLNNQKIQRPLYYNQQKGSNILETGGTIRWDMSNANAIQTKHFPLSRNSIEHIRYFSDGKRVVLTQGNEVSVYDLETQKELAHFGEKGWRTHDTSSNQVELSPDESKIIATANLDRNIMVWDINQSKLDYTIPNTSGNSNSFQLSTDGKYIISLNRLPNGSNTDGYGWRLEEGTISIWNLKTGILERSLPRLVTTFAIVPNSNFIILGENDGSVSLWDIRNGLERFKLLGHEQSIQSLKVLPNNHQLLSRDRQNNAILWDNIQNEPKGTKMFHGIPYRTTLSHNGNYILIPQEEYKKEGKIRLLNLKTSQYEYEFAFPIHYAMLRSFSNDDRYFFLSTPENATKVFETATGKELAILQAYDNGEWIILTPQGYFNASLNGDHFITDSSGKPIDNITYKKYFNPDEVKNIFKEVQ
ncbi:WD40 repeat domain-containing protein [Sulfuricurvum sp.]|uniref:WD40 repeat domain-containing protein n=1 Tax=Sulfuricurvum sp. TaxID=2025608 RepID=UPI002601E923|nr:WD40 repeat domain-containing protein [Sulfuricurvum sp.]MDD2781888.1 WD40 repeat domain-containing protein [Sulfuricurvum sp.]